VTALHDVDLTIPPGQFVCVLGPSGSGKTTLLDLIAGLEPPSTGTVRVGATDVHALSLDAAARWRRRDVGMVPQSFHLIPSLTLAQNVATPLILDGCSLRAALAPVDALLERLGILHRREHALEELSGGELQRVAIARALVARPGLVLADEPTRNLDQTTGAEVLRLFREVVHERGATTLMVTHDLGVTAAADRVVTIRDGRIVDDRSAPPSHARARRS
jgi:putative ABC transport system ATP-binding protein